MVKGTVQMNENKLPINWFLHLLLKSLCQRPDSGAIKALCRGSINKTNEGILKCKFQWFLCSLTSSGQPQGKFFYCMSDESAEPWKQFDSKDLFP